MEEILEFSDMNPEEEEADDAETAKLISRRLSVLEEVRFLIVYDFKLYVALDVTMIQAREKKIVRILPNEKCRKNCNLRTVTCSLGLSASALVAELSYVHAGKLRVLVGYIYKNRRNGSIKLSEE